GGGAMLKHLPQLMKFKTAMDVRIGLPNEHLTGVGRDEINQPMYATAVGLVMRGFEYLEMYKKSFSAGRKEVYVTPPVRERIDHDEAEPKETEEQYQPEPKTSLTEKIKIMMMKMFEVEDQPIN
ncbi:MAG: hypothetical protein GT600_06575, partial [Bacteroidales bacterium]|nr:hypothetical protein [Bacteroidales bacterium]